VACGRVRITVRVLGHSHTRAGGRDTSWLNTCRPCTWGWSLCVYIKTAAIAGEWLQPLANLGLSMEPDILHFNLTWRRNGSIIDLSDVKKEDAVNERSGQRLVLHLQGLKGDCVANTRVCVLDDWSLIGVSSEENVNPPPSLARRRTQVEDLRIRLTGWHFEAAPQTQTFILKLAQ
jgi:hypothetical protein